MKDMDWFEVYRKLGKKGLIKELCAVILVSASTITLCSVIAIVFVEIFKN